MKAKYYLDLLLTGLGVLLIGNACLFNLVMLSKHGHPVLMAGSAGLMAYALFGLTEYVRANRKARKG